MAEIAGYGGDVKMSSNAVPGMDNWTITYTADTHEVTDFADAGVKAYVAGGTGWSGTVSGKYQDTSAAATLYNTTYKPGVSKTAKFYFSASSAHLATGTIIFTGWDFATGIDGAITATFNFQGTGGLTIS